LICSETQDSLRMHESLNGLISSDDQGPT